MALSEVRVPPFYRGNWQGDFKTIKQHVFFKKFARFQCSHCETPNSIVSEIMMTFLQEQPINRQAAVKGGMKYKQQLIGIHSLKLAVRT